MTKRFIEGKTRTYAEIAEHTWSPHRGSHSVPPDTPFRYSLDPETGHGYFDEVTEPVNPLVSSERAQLHVEAMREDGMTYRQIARLAGVSVESVHRSASGVGRIRASTEDALVKGRLLDHERQRSQAGMRMKDDPRMRPLPGWKPSDVAALRALDPQ